MNTESALATDDNIDYQIYYFVALILVDNLSRYYLNKKALLTQAVFIDFLTYRPTYTYH